jgi:hypothetical protein
MRVKCDRCDSVEQYFKIAVDKLKAKEAAYDEAIKQRDGFQLEWRKMCNIVDDAEAKLKIAVAGIKRLRSFVRVDVKHGYISPEFADSIAKSIDNLLSELETAVHAVCEHPSVITLDTNPSFTSCQVCGHVFETASQALCDAKGKK